MILYLVRHGETAYNRDGVSLGREDAPLTVLGESQAADIAHALADQPLDRMYVSPLERAMATAAAIARGREAKLEVRNELVELDAGDAEGLTFPELRERFGPFLSEWAGPSGHEAAMPGGESIRDLDRRLEPFVEELRQAEVGASAVVSHNFVLRVLACRLMGLDVASFRNVVFDVASISAFSINTGRVVVLRLNDICHLHALNLDPDGRTV